MNANSLYFELFSIVFLLGLGSLLLFIDLPGWGLISIAGLLATLSFGLRKVAATASEAASPV